MAILHTQTLAVTLSKVQKQHEPQPEMISQAAIAELENIIQELVEPTVVVEIQVIDNE